MKRGAISDSGRWENFEDHASDGYSAATIEEQGWPMREKREKRIDEWIDDVSNNVKLNAADSAAKNTPERPLTDQANWRSAGQDVAIDPEEQRWENGVASFAFGEDVEVWEDREGIRRLINQMIARTNEIRSFKQGEMAFGDAAVMANRPFENPENDLHVSRELSAHEDDMEVDGASEFTGV
jgi:hypothetical protein